MKQENTIIIKQPYIDVYNHANGEELHRLNAEIIENGKSHKVFVEVKKEFGEYLCTERSDAFLWLTLPVAMREGYDIYCEAPVTDQLLHNINEMLIPHLVMGDNRLKNIEIHCETATENISVGGGIGTGVSCGVDSTYAIMQATNGKYKSLQLTHLFIGSVNIELWNTKNATIVEWIDEHKQSFERYQYVADELNLSLVSAYTNFFYYVCSRDQKVYSHLFVNQYITMASVLALKKLWKAYFLASALDFTTFSLINSSTEDTDKTDLLTMYTLTENGFTCYSGGAKASRIEKTKALADYPLAQKVLHPCHSRTNMNCSEPHCQKCMRGLFALDYYDKLDNMKAVFDVEKYRKNKKEYFVSLIKSKDNEFFVELYGMMKEKYPKEMEEAEKTYKERTAPISRGEFNTVKRIYDVVCNLMSLDNPKQFIVDFFKTKGIQKLYKIGGSVAGNKIIDMIKDEFEIVSLQTGKSSECDAAFIISTNDADIKLAKTNLGKQGCKKYYTIFDIHAECLKGLNNK